MVIDNKSTIIPKNKLIKISDKRLITVALFPKILVMVAIEVVFVAAPTIRKTSAAPHVTPFPIIASAIGMDAVAHIYKGKPMTIMTIIDINP